MKKNNGKSIIRSLVFTLLLVAAWAVTAHASADGVVNYHAVLIGNTYPGIENYELDGPDRDYVNMASALSALKVPYTISGAIKNASTNQFYAAIKNMASSADEDDVSLFYYSGHGAMEGSNSGAIYMVDNGKVAEISLAVLESSLRTVPGRVVVILDSCGSGAAISKSMGKASQKGTTASEAKRFSMSARSIFQKNDRFIQPMEGSLIAKSGEFINNKYYVIAACQTGTSSWAFAFDSAGHKASLLTYILVESLGSQYGVNGSTRTRSPIPSDTNGDGLASLAECYAYISSRVAEAQKEFPFKVGEKPQVPVVYPENSSQTIFSDQDISGTNVIVTFDANGGSCSTASSAVDSNGFLLVLPEAVRNGYTFEGWFTAQSGGERITNTTVFRSSGTVYAHWILGGPRVASGRNAKDGNDLYSSTNTVPNNTRTAANASVYNRTASAAANTSIPVYGYSSTAQVVNTANASQTTGQTAGANNTVRPTSAYGTTRTQAADPGVSPHDSLSAVHEIVEFLGNKTVAVMGIVSKLKTVRLTGRTVTPEGTLPVSRIKTGAFAGTGCTKFVLDIRKKPIRPITFETDAFGGSNVAMLALKGPDASFFKFQKGALNGISKVTISGMDDSEYQLMIKKIKASKFKGQISYAAS